MQGCLQAPTHGEGDCKWRTVLPGVYKDDPNKLAVYRMDWWGWDDFGITTSLSRGSCPAGFDLNTCYEALSDMDITLTYTKVGADVTIDWVWKCNATEGNYVGKVFEFHQGCSLADPSRLGVVLSAEFAILTITRAEITRA